MLARFCAAEKESLKKMFKIEVFKIKAVLPAWMRPVEVFVLFSGRAPFYNLLKPELKNLKGYIKNV